MNPWLKVLIGPRVPGLTRSSRKSILRSSNELKYYTLDVKAYVNYMQAVMTATSFDVCSKYVPKF